MKRISLAILLGVATLAQADSDDRAEQTRRYMAVRFREADMDGNGSLSKQEAERRMPYVARNFEAIDGDRNGQVSAAELQAHLARRH